MVEIISLSSATAANVMALKRTTAAINQTQERLATGLRVNGAIDNAVAYFDASTLTARAKDIQLLKDSIDQGVTTVQTAVGGVEAIENVVEEMKGLALSAKSDSSSTNRSKAAVQFNDLKNQLDNLANDSTFKGTNLLKGSPANLKVTFSEDGSSTLTVSGIASDASALSITTAASNWAADTNVDFAVNDLDSALTTLRSTAITLGSNATIVALRLDFADTLISALQEGSGKLVDADLNQESATLLTLQTRLQLGTIGLSIAQQSDQAIFRLF